MVPFSTPNVARCIGTTSSPRPTPSERLAELVHHLSGAPLADARRAVHHHAHVDQLDDPLAIVAGALVQLWHQPRLRPTISCVHP